MLEENSKVSFRLTQYHNPFGKVIANILGEGLCEISPLISFGGEGLESHVKGKTITLPFYLNI